MPDISLKGFKVAEFSCPDCEQNYYVFKEVFRVWCPGCDGSYYYDEIHNDLNLLVLEAKK